LRLIHDTIRRLAEFPEIAAPRPELREGLRSAPVREHRIYYRFANQTIRVARVLHKARDVERHI
jgi:toxin ParE1/3/4